MQLRADPFFWRKIKSKLKLFCMYKVWKWMIYYGTASGLFETGTNADSKGWMRLAERLLFV